MLHPLYSFHFPLGLHDDAIRHILVDVAVLVSVDLIGQTGGSTAAVRACACGAAGLVGGLGPESAI